MGCTGQGGVVWWCLPLAGLLLAVAASGADDGAVAAEVEAVETGGRGGSREGGTRWCKKDCEWKGGQDKREVSECKEECERRRQGEQRDDGGGHGDRCQRRCQHHQDWWRKQQCVQECRHRQGEDDIVAGEDHHGSGHEDRCRRQCQHHQDQWRKQQCMQDCRRQHGEDGAADEEEISYAGLQGDSCRKQCQHHGRGYEKQQCLRDCEIRRREGGGSGGTGGRGREGDERHGWETVAGAILQAV